MPTHTRPRESAVLGLHLEGGRRPSISLVEIYCTLVPLKITVIRKASHGD